MSTMVTLKHKDSDDIEPGTIIVWRQEYELNIIERATLLQKKKDQFIWSLELLPKW